MGLDQYAYKANRAGQRAEFYEDGEFVNGEWKNPSAEKPEDLAYWRKHPNLQGWMEQLWLRKGGSNSGSQWGSNFNGVELELTWEDLDELEQDVLNGDLPSTQGFFFGSNSDNEYKEDDLKFIGLARLALTEGYQVFYNSSW